MRRIDLITTEVQTVKWFMDRIKSDTLIIDHSFQRKFVWGIKEQVRLIETILLGFSIPEIYIWMTETDPDTGDSTYSLVDGQQRLSTVKDFLSGKFKLHSGYLNDVESNKYANKKFSELDPEDKKAIWDYPFSTRVIKREIKEEDIIKMFLRLNSTDKQLNPQELRNAEFSGLFIKLADEISEQPFWEKHKVFSSSQIRRMTDIEFISQILIFLREGITGETTQKYLNSVYDKYNEKYDEYENDKEIFLRMIVEMEMIMELSKENADLLSKKTHLYSFLIIIYFMIEKGLDISKYHEKISVFVNCYNNPNEDFSISTDEKSLIRDYKNYVLEGTQSKARRIARVRVLKSYLNI
ncbi:GmrSD restriction endonuclease domain-containing protein [Lysinibacillus xylanilyticus]|uniref:GmrSD restriction endonuclease domain-containing protein n=1 Tax=Lysinibacillus xylanilyticus TaxID=582475 RepID=UPI00382202D6